MALVSQFLNAGDLTRAAESGERSVDSLLRLQRELRAADQKFIFDQEANPLRLEKLTEDIQATRLDNTFNARTLDSRVQNSDATARFNTSRADVAERTVDDAVRQQQQATAQGELVLIQDRANLQEFLLTSRNRLESAALDLQAQRAAYEIQRSVAARNGSTLPPPPKALTSAQNELAESLQAMVAGISQLGSVPDAAPATPTPATAPTPQAVDPAVAPIGAPNQDLPLEQVQPAPAVRALDPVPPPNVVTDANVNSPAVQQLLAPASSGLNAALENAGFFSERLGDAIQPRVTGIERSQGSDPLAQAATAQAASLPITDTSATRVRNVNGGTPVSDGGAIVRQLFPRARITQTRRNPFSRLGKANRNSFHVRTNAAVDVAPIPGITFGQFVNTIASRGYVVLEAIDEVRNPSSHATGPHWHVVIGDRRS